MVRILYRMKLSAVIPVVNWSFSGVAGPSERKDLKNYDILLPKLFWPTVRKKMF